jgi:hypothetical protein
MLIPATGSLWPVYPNDAYILSYRVGNAHHRRILLESTKNEFQTQEQIFI